MGRADYLDLGNWNAVCWECGRKRKASELARNWQGYYVCPEHWEPRQPQDFVKNVIDDETVPWSQPSEYVVATSTTIGALTTLAGGCSDFGCTLAIPSVAEPGCMVPSLLIPDTLAEFIAFRSLDGE